MLKGFAKREGMKRIVYFGLIALCASCASNVHYDRDKEGPKREGVALLWRESVHDSGTSYHDEVGAVAAAVAGTALAVNPDYYHKSSITGVCVFSKEKFTIEDVPCRGKKLLLIDDKGKEVASAVTTIEGKFRVYPPEKGTFSIRPADPKLSLIQELKDVRQGADVVLRLKSP
jgi:hypothetical protein